MAKNNNTEVLIGLGLAAAAAVAIVIAMRPTPAQTLAQAALQAQQNALRQQNAAGMSAGGFGQNSMATGGSAGTGGVLSNAGSAFSSLFS